MLSFWRSRNNSQNSQNIARNSRNTRTLQSDNMLRSISSPSSFNSSKDYVGTPRNSNNSSVPYSCDVKASRSSSYISINQKLSTKNRDDFWTRSTSEVGKDEVVISPRQKFFVYNKSKGSSNNFPLSKLSNCEIREIIDNWFIESEEEQHVRKVLLPLPRINSR